MAPEPHPNSAKQLPFGDCHGNLALAETKVKKDLPRGQATVAARQFCFASEGAERVAGNKMALNVERIVDGCQSASKIGSELTFDEVEAPVWL